MNARQVIRILEDNGFEFEREGKGSHVIYRKGTITVTVPIHGKKELKLKTLNAILKQAGLK
ncbi:MULTISPECIES: type II toxin-antitoxin system HicA family toxin [Leptospira]|uniref:YcfA-like protein n=2 Tax=Leptospira santarosai TaxID=28183 RepID=A0A2P1QQP1_9LEPT|nr:MULTISPECIES: type II toxin-antitoxin system HicA family toxin [Leptospira]AVQ11218.1 YcfA-like protein [Leptospira santarosai]EKO79176.1 YcfA-like protein [Leptospira sp. Fiocruz LV3954]EMI61822.1 YcfA-like protein [Leptospira sp. Fiocruz LV4135]MDI7158051.1 type II toxin-antitoxin system HicA family toxin [Leptospira santarosai]MDO6395836.1 type II toxin-antitoxin system HicA family toxin [Leptospira santarosai]